MIITMIAVRMVQVTVNKIINVIPMRHRLMSALRAMHMPRRVTAAAGRALIGIFRTHLDGMFIHMLAVWMMEMAIMQIVDVITVANGRVATAGAMLMVVVRMVREIATAHRLLPSQACWCFGGVLHRVLAKGTAKGPLRPLEFTFSGPPKKWCRVRDTATVPHLAAGILNKSCISLQLCQAHKFHRKAL